MYMSSSMAAKSFTNVSKYDGYSSLTITDASGNSQVLYFGNAQKNIGANNSTIMKSELPPVPPQGVFDARFASNKFIEVTQSGSVSELPLKISAVNYPVKLSWNVQSTASTQLLIDGKTQTIQGVGSMIVQNSSAQVSVRVNSTSATMPHLYSLQQNYPNPFNPVTIIRYALPENNHVTLKLYDVLGREIATLINGDISAGEHQIEWNAGNLPSGIYYYRIQAGNFTETKKLLLTK